MLEQHGGQAVPMLGVAYDERDLGITRAGHAVVPGDPQQLAVAFGHQRQPVPIVDLREPVPPRGTRGAGGR